MITISKFLTLIACFIFVCDLYGQETGKYIEQYEGTIGARTFTVKVLRIGEKENEEVLIQIIGVDDPLDGQIYKYKKEWQSSEKRNNRYIYVTKQIPGKERFAALHSDNNYGRQVFKVFLMDTPMEAIYIYPKAYQENLDPNFMYSQYLQQQEKR
jgi:hypothetical protein